MGKIPVNEVSLPPFFSRTAYMYIYIFIINIILIPYFAKTKFHLNADISQEESHFTLPIFSEFAFCPGPDGVG